MATDLEKVKSEIYLKYNMNMNLQMEQRSKHTQVRRAEKIIWASS